MSFLLSLMCIFFAMVPFQPSTTSKAQSPEDSIGNGQCTVFCRIDGFQEGMKYEEYEYNQVTFEDTPYFQPVTEECIDELLRVLDNFEGFWIEGMDDAPTEEGRIFYQGYDYDRTTLDPADYYYLDTSRANYPLEVYELTSLMHSKTRCTTAS